MFLKWFPRSWIQVKAGDLVIYFDPSYISSYYKKYSKKIIFSQEEDDCLPEELEKADLILVSHIHKDHCKDITLKRLSKETTVVLTPQKYKDSEDSRVRITKSGNKYVFEKGILSEYAPDSYPLYENKSEEVNSEHITIKTVDAYNTESGHSVRKVHKKGKCVGYIIGIEGKRIYFSGDTDYIPEMKQLTDIDIAIVPIGGIFTMDMEEAVEAVLEIRPKHVIPVHHLKNDPREFKAMLEKRMDIDVRLLETGGFCRL